MSLVEIHGRLANTALFFTLALALWGLFRYFRKQGLDSSYWGALIIGEVVYLVQGALGAYLFFSGVGNLTGRYIHILYGVTSLLVIPAVFAFTRGEGEGERRVQLVYALALLFLVGIMLRAQMTAG